jgi:hypothetical protein
VPRGVRSPFDPKIPKSRRKALAKRLRAALAAEPMDMQRISDALAIEPEETVVVLRRLRSRRGGRLHSTIRFGHVCWWWEPKPKKARDTAEKDGKKRRKNRAEGTDEGAGTESQA